MSTFSEEDAQLLEALEDVASQNVFKPMFPVASPFF